MLWLALIQARMTTIVNSFLHKRRPNEWNNGPECILPCSCSLFLDASGRLYAHVSETSRPPPAGGRRHMTRHTNNVHKDNDPSEYNILQQHSYSVISFISTQQLLPCFAKRTPRHDIWMRRCPPPFRMDSSSSHHQSESIVKEAWILQLYFGTDTSDITSLQVMASVFSPQT